MTTKDFRSEAKLDMPLDTVPYGCKRALSLFRRNCRIAFTVSGKCRPFFPEFLIKLRPSFVSRLNLSLKFLNIKWQLIPIHSGNLGEKCFQCAAGAKAGKRRIRLQEAISQLAV